MQKINENISKQDIFTPALDLNYNGDENSKSVTGGFCWI